MDDGITCRIVLGNAFEFEHRISFGICGSAKGRLEFRTQLSYPLDAAAYEKEWGHGSKVATSDTWGRGRMRMALESRVVCRKTRDNTLDVMFFYNYYLFKYVAQAKKDFWVHCSWVCK